ncbi:hypothetical protein NPIL_510341 [Nephila pilipes]|uniref:Uncharacterized protein n=1 Tax=Nephila pilipes TaxID=299642 RepID=A0A8X6Q9L1_NEPPI|nr:hypothetical protein NPIL_510341 [Nephila pilipes]
MHACGHAQLFLSHSLFLLHFARFRLGRSLSFAALGAGINLPPSSAYFDRNMEDGGGGKEWQFSRHCPPHPVTRGLPVDSQPGGEGSDNDKKTNNRLRHPASEVSRAPMMETQVPIHYHSAPSFIQL